MKTTLIGGRQGTGKTETLIEYLSEKDQPTLLFTFDHDPTNHHFFHLPDHITIFGKPDLSNANILELVKEKAPHTVAIDSVDVLPEDLANHEFVELLKGFCQELVLTSHLTDNEELNEITSTMVDGETYNFVHV